MRIFPFNAYSLINLPRHVHIFTNPASWLGFNLSKDRKDIFFYVEYLSVEIQWNRVNTVINGPKNIGRITGVG